VRYISSLKSTRKVVRKFVASEQLGSDIMETEIDVVN
jgi:hypothetical protein